MPEGEVWGLHRAKYTDAEAEAAIAAATGLTMPAFTMGGDLNMGSKDITYLKYIYSRVAGAMHLFARYQAADQNFTIWTTGAASGYPDTVRVRFYGGAAEAAVAWENCNHTGLKLGGTLDMNSQSVSNWGGGLKLDDLATPDDNTDLDVSTSVHGLAPKITNTANFLKGDGTWAAPAGGGDVTGPGSSVDNAIVRFNGTGGKTIQDYTSGAPTIGDTGVSAFEAGATFTLPADEQILVDGRTTERTTSLGVIRINLTPASGDIGEDCINLDVDANSVNDIMGIIVNYLATGLAAGNENMALELNVETADATGGVVAGVEVSKSGVGTLEVQGLHCDAGVIPIHQESGTFGNVEKVWEFESGPTWTDITAACNDAGNDVEIFSAENDIIYIGDAAKFEEINITLATVASGPGIKPTFAFSAGGSSWTAFTPNDTTSGCRHTGIIAWEIGDVSGWATDTVNSTTNKYWIRITRTQTSLSTPPIEDRIQIAVTTEYGWDENAAITSKTYESKVASGTAPLVVASTTVVANLNVDKLDGSEAADFLKKDGSVKLTGSWDIGEFGIQLDPTLSADGTWSGITETGTAGTALVFGDLCHFTAASSRWDLALANTATTSKGLLGMCVLAATAGSEATEVLLYGKIRADAKFPNLPIGDPVFISAGTVGVVAGTASSGTSDYVVRIVGHGKTANVLVFQPDNTYIEIA